MSDRRHYSTLILGGGIMGAATAENLARRGQRVLLLEQFQPGHDRGSSHGDGRIIRFSYAEPVYVEMAQRAYPAWARLERAGGQKLLEICGGLDLGPDDSAAIAELRASMRGAGVGCEQLTAAAVARRFPQLRLPRGSTALYQPQGGIVRAERAVHLLWQLARAAGAETLTGTPVSALEPTAEGVLVRTADGREAHGETAVIAAGGWSRQLLALLGLTLELSVTAEVVAYFPAQNGVDHRLGALPTVIDYHDPNPFYALPQIEVPGVKVGWHHTGEVIDPGVRTAETSTQLRVHARIQDFVTERFPALIPTPIHRTTCLYTNTPDHHFILDRHPSWEHIVIAAGFSGHGFKFGPVIGELLTALVMDEAPAVPLETFRLARLNAPLNPRTTA